MASEEEDSKYVNHLEESSRRICHDELHERNDADTLIAVQTLRKWVLEHERLRTPTDYRFLLRFLRFRKFSQLDARKALEHFWTVRCSHPEWFVGEDPTDELMQKVIRMQMMCCPKQRDKHGRRVMIMKFDKVDVDFIKTTGLHKLYRASSLVLDWMMYDEHLQVEGHVMIADFRGLTFELFKAMFNREFEEKYTEYFHHAMPNRMKSMDVVNEPHFFDLIWAMIAPIMPQKMKDRFHLHGHSLVKIYEEVGYECLPEEYLPDEYDGPKSGTCDEIVDAMLEDMTHPDFLEYIRDLSSGKYGVHKVKGDHMETEGSFRKIVE
ncbi:alpha-tocopherol transfer protein-like [Mya arenaria]|uniref:alpha-tocopherol transfer protein-like n=1 Tax=Mya arenaria TaxID=6604 RepID=UPI0022E0A262|nr:alpha-tocopherol transfer protein-like [Mya arenaria]